MKIEQGRRILSAALAITVVGFGANAQTLEDALVKAYQSNPTIKADRARLRATDEGVPQAISNWRPTVDLSGSTGWDRTDSTTSRTVRNRTTEISNPASATLSVTQNLYRGGRTIAATEEAENNVRADRARLSSTEQGILLNAATAYADVVRDQAVLELNENNERVLQRQLEATQDRFRVGEVTRTDVSQAESRLSRATADRIAAEGSLIDSQANYENIIGERPGRLQSEPPLGGLPGSLDDATSAAKDGNFDVQRTRFIEASARNNVDEIVGELLPAVSVTGSLQTNHETVNSNSESQEMSVIAQVSMPLYASGSVTSRVREAKQLVSQRRDELAQAVRDAVEDATEAWQQLSTGRAQIEAFTAEVTAAEIALEGVREEANVGSRTVLDVLDAEQELLNARVSLVRAQRDVLVATYQLRQAVGSLTARQLGLPVQLYDVETNYRDVRGKWWGLSAGDGR